MTGYGLSLTKQTLSFIIFIDWNQALCIDSNEIDRSFKDFLDKVKSLLDLYEPSKKFQKTNKNLGTTMY